MLVTMAQGVLTSFKMRCMEALQSCMQGVWTDSRDEHVRETDSSAPICIEQKEWKSQSICKLQ